VGYSRHFAVSCVHLRLEQPECFARERKIFTAAKRSSKLNTNDRSKSNASGGSDMTITKTTMTVLLFCLASLSAWAENSTSIPGHTIHHNAIPSASLDPAIAKQYGIQRSKYRGMLNVSIIKTQPGTTGKSVSAVVMAKATNMMGQLISIPMRQIEEGDAIYYIGEFRIADQETLNFELQVKPWGESRFHTAKLSQQFFIDD
jgi:hypothetical protein